MKNSSMTLLLLLGFGVILLIPACTNSTDLDISPTPTSELISAIDTSVPDLENQVDESNSSINIQADETTEIDILKTNYLFDSLGNLLVLGLVQNNTQGVVTNILVEVQLVDNNGDILHKEKISTLLNNLPINQVSPFVLRVFNAPTGFQHAEIKILDYEIGEIEPAVVETLGIAETGDDENTLHITGEIYNNHLDPIIINGLASVIFDTAGDIIAADTLSTLNLYLDPGEKGPFRITMLGINPDLVSGHRSKLYYDAITTTPREYYDLVIAEPNSYLDQSDSFHLVSEVTNNSQESLDLSLIAGIYDVGGTVLDASSSSLPISSIQPGETLPFDFNVWGPMTLKHDTPGSAVKFSIQWNPLLTSHVDWDYIDLSAENLELEIENYSGLFEGRITNNSDFPVTNITVIISLYDKATEKILATNHTTMNTELLVEESTQYEIHLDLYKNLAVEDIKVIVIAKGKIPE